MVTCFNLPAERWWEYLKVRHLEETREKVFGDAKVEIEKKQKQYVRQYEKRNTVNKKFPIKVNDRVQYRNTKHDKRMGGKFEPKWFPLNTFLVVKKIVYNRNYLELRKKIQNLLTKQFILTTLDYFLQKLRKRTKRKSVDILLPS